MVPEKADDFITLFEKNHDICQNGIKTFDFDILTFKS